MFARRVASALPAALEVPSSEQVYSQGGRGGGGAVRGSGGRRGAPRPQPYDRNKFLQANFRFLVSDAGDLRRWEADADLMPDWEDVLEVRSVAPILVGSTRVSPTCCREAERHESTWLGEAIGDGQHASWHARTHAVARCATPEASPAWGLVGA